MKINKLFHWLYFIVMMLPIMVAPIFAIYSHRHTIDNYSVVRVEPYEVNAFQYVINGKPNNFNLWSYSDCSASFQNYLNNDVILVQTDAGQDFSVSTQVSNASFTVNDILYLSYNVGFGDIDDYDDFYIELIDTNGAILARFNDFDDGFYYKSVSCDYTLIGTSLRIGGMSYGDNDFYLNKLMLFNLTYIFGTGNEPTADVFLSYLDNDYYDYGDNSLTVGTHNVTFQDSDIGSQFVYDLYNCVDKYFNYDKVFNFADLYGWLQLTFFGGNAPLGFFIFWHLLLYWLLTSLIWLLFDVLIYVPMLVHRWLDKASLS